MLVINKKVNTNQFPHLEFLRRLLVFTFFICYGNIYSQNYLNSTYIPVNTQEFNSAPYRYNPFWTVDSFNNKIIFNTLSHNITTPNFVTTGNTLKQNYTITKYDSLNNIKWLKIIETDSLIANKNNVKTSCFTNDQGDIYCFFYCKNYFKLNNITYNTPGENFVQLKLSSTGTLINYSPTCLQGHLYVFHEQNMFYCIGYPNNSFSCGSFSPNSTRYIAIMDTNGIINSIKNIPELDSLTYIDYFITDQFNNKYISAHRFEDSSLVYQFDPSLNFIKKSLFSGHIQKMLTSDNKIFIYGHYGQLNYQLPNNYLYKVFLLEIDTQLNQKSIRLFGRTDSTQTNNVAIDAIKYRNNFVFAYVAFNANGTTTCNTKPRSNADIIILTTDTLFNCISSLQVTSAQYTSPYFWSYMIVSWYYKLSLGSQLNIITDSDPAHSIPSDSTYFAFLNNHVYPIGKFSQRYYSTSGFQIPCAYLTTFHFGQWIECLTPNVLRYCVGDSINIPYNKYGFFDGNTTFKLEACTNRNFTGVIRVINSWKDSLTGNLSNARILIPNNFVAGTYYIRIKSTLPNRISNLSDSLILISTKPFVNAGTDTTVCFGDSLALEGSSNSPNFYWTSNIPNYFTDSTIINPKILANDSAICILHAINASGCENSDTVRVNVIPKIDLKFNKDSVYPLCENRNLNLSITTNYNDSIIMNWGEGVDTILKGNNSKLFHSYSSTGLKAISIKGIANKCFDSTGFFIQVRNPFQLATSNDTTLCFGNIMSIWAIASGGDSVYNYILKTPSGNLTNNGGTFLVQPDSTTTYALGAVNNCAKDTLWKKIKITLLPQLRLTINTIDTTLCKGNNFVIKANATGGNGKYVFYLRKNNVLIQSNTSGVFSILIVANETYSILLRDNCSLKNDSISVNIKVFNTLSFNQKLGDKFLCTGDAVNFKAQTNNGSGKPKFEWKDGMGNILSITDSLSFVPNSSTTIILKVTDECSVISDTSMVYMFATSNSINLIADISSGCAPLTVNFETPILSFSNNVEYEITWDFGDGFSETSKFGRSIVVLKAKHVYNKEGIYPVLARLKFKNGNTFCLTFTNSVEALLIPQISLSVNPTKITLPKTKCTATLLTVSADSVVIDWADGSNDNYISNLNSIIAVHDYSDTGHYNIKATAYNKYTCYSEAYFNVYHADTFYCFIPNVFSPNRDALNETFQPVVSYCKSYQMFIYNSWGELIFDVSSSTSPILKPSWNGEGCESGNYIYMIKAIDGDGQRHDYKGTVMMLK